MSLRRSRPPSPRRPLPISIRDEGSGTTEEIGEAEPLTSAMTPVGPPPLSITKSRVFTPALNPLVIENEIRDAKLANEVQEPVFVPFRKRQPSLSDVHSPESCAVLATRPARLKVVW